MDELCRASSSRLYRFRGRPGVLTYSQGRGFGDWTPLAPSIPSLLGRAWSYPAPCSRVLIAEDAPHNL